jgi:nuclear control of ATPase protein 2
VRLQQLQSLIRRLSTTSSPQSTISSYRLKETLETAVSDFARASHGLHTTETDLQWCVVGKAAVQTYGLVLNTFLDQILPLSIDIWYWDEILGSYSNTSLYTLQTSPLRFWSWTQDIYHDSKQRFQQVMSGDDPHVYDSLAARWKQYYGLVRDSIRDRSLVDLQSKFVSPITQARVEARLKQKQLKRLRDLSASGLGILMDEGFSFEVDEFGAAVDRSWQQIISKSIMLMDAVLSKLATTPDMTTHEIEEQAFGQVDDYVDHDGAEWNRPPALAQSLLDIVNKRLPTYQSSMSVLVIENGRPSRVVRYWIPATALLLSSGTLLRVFFNRKSKILQWIQEFGATSRDFWYNWVVDPIKKIVGTIRHDKESEIALMSKESLEGDRSSLERMVVDFAVDNASSTSGAPLTQAQVDEVRNKVREGDLTPVLKAYEKDLRKPLIGVVRGDLVRALLIQIQKTKVDVEVAIGGIDSLLKSQELVFG